MLDAAAIRFGGFFFAATDATQADALASLGRALAGHTGGGRYTFADWDEALERLVAAGVLEDLGSGSVSFVHPLFAQALLDAQPSAVRERRHAAQPKGIRTFGSTFKNPPGASAWQLLVDAGAGELRFGGARFSPKHANFVENTGGASTAEIVALIAAGRELVRERFGVELEPEVQLLGEVRFPW